VRVGIVGDSQSEGLAPWLVAYLEAKGWQIAGVFASRGMSLSNMRASAERTAHARAVADGSPDALVVVLGGNNAISDRAAYAELVSWFMGSIAVRPREIWWIGPAASLAADRHTQRLRTRELQRELVPRDRRAKWIDGWAMTSSGVQHAPDGLHFTRAGYQAWAARLARALPPSSSAPAGLYVGAALLGVAVGGFLALVRG